MSPEQCRGRAVDRRSDVFALGTILYELTTGAAPFTGDSDLEILNRIATGVAPPPVWPEEKGVYPAALADIVMRALAPAPDHRYPTMQALQVALETFAREASISVSTVALGGLMQRLFAEELAAWREAQRAGKSLGEHLAARPVPVRSTDGEERTATDAFGPTRRRVTTGRKWARGLALAAFAAVFALAGGLAAKKWKTDAEQVPAPPVAVPAAVGAGGPAPPAEMKLPAVPKLVAAEVVATPAAAAPPHVRRGKRAHTETTSPSPAPVSRLHTWDPDSPKPP
jgi:serine/threonine-protein kinase